MNITDSVAISNWNVPAARFQLHNLWEESKTLDEKSNITKIQKELRRERVFRVWYSLSAMVSSSRGRIDSWKGETETQLPFQVWIILYSIQLVIKWIDCSVPIFRRERRDDRTYVCASQPRFPVFVSNYRVTPILRVTWQNNECQAGWLIMTWNDKFFLNQQHNLSSLIL